MDFRVYDADYAPTVLVVFRLQDPEVYAERMQILSLSEIFCALLPQAPDAISM